MHSMHSLLKELREHYPQFTFTSSDTAYWNPEDRTVFYSDNIPELLHELGHAILKHQEYRRDIELLKIESDAWEYAAKTLAPLYHIDISEEIAQDSLDSYRDWLHSRSTCPECRATGIQTSPAGYTCIVCRSKWRVNEAKNCELRRYKINPPR
ncbi:MAG TPA: hypothetical protein VJ841_01970 [Candidatus Saccharimonadales bacterium]|nr:hypothetical protein [Candidatus Saccharimonadales bacterium]